MWFLRYFNASAGVLRVNSWNLQKGLHQLVACQYSLLAACKKKSNQRSWLDFKHAPWASGPFPVWAKRMMMNDDEWLTIMMMMPSTPRLAEAQLVSIYLSVWQQNTRPRRRLATSGTFYFWKSSPTVTSARKGIPFQVREGVEVPDPQNIKVLILAGVGGRKKGIMRRGHTGLHGGRGWGGGMAQAKFFLRKWMSPLVDESWEVTSELSCSSGSIFLASCFPSSTLWSARGRRTENN